MLNRNDESNEIKKLMLFSLAAASTVLLLFLVVIFLNDNKDNKKYLAKPNSDLSETDEDLGETSDFDEDEEISVGKQNVVSEDLDFWDMYESEDRKPIGDIEDEEQNKEQIIEDRAKEAAEKIKNPTGNKKESEQEAESKKSKVAPVRVKAKSRDGSEAWYDVMGSLAKNTYDFSEYLGNEKGLLKYNAPGVRCYAGIDLTNKVGTVDFDKINNFGIDYVMIRVAARMQDTGIIAADDRFIEYVNGAKAASIPCGVFFSSQAINDVEAIEEANFIVAAIASYDIKYPIAIDLSGSNGNARTDRLTSSERTQIVKKFCETVKAFGKRPVIYASRDMLIADLNLEDLKEYDIWLRDDAVTADSLYSNNVSDEDAIKKSAKDEDAKNKDTKKSEDEVEPASEQKDYIGTDYPYDFSMWHYTDNGTVDGISQNVGLNMSFVNYAE